MLGLLIVSFVLLGVLSALFQAHQMGRKQERGSRAEEINKAAHKAMRVRRRILSDPDYRQRMRQKYK